MGSQTCPNEASGTNGKNFNSIIEIVCLDNGVKIPALQRAKYWLNQDLTWRLGWVDALKIFNPHCSSIDWELDNHDRQGEKWILKLRHLDNLYRTVPFTESPKSMVSWFNVSLRVLEEGIKQDKEAVTLCQPGVLFFSLTFDLKWSH